MKRILHSRKSQSQISALRSAIEFCHTLTQFFETSIRYLVKAIYGSHETFENNVLLEANKNQLLESLLGSNNFCQIFKVNIC